MTLTTDLMIAPAGDGFVLLEQVRRSEISLHPDADGALAAATSALKDTGGRILLSAGRYTIHAAVDLPSRTTLTGVGSATEVLVGGTTGIRAERCKQSRITDLRVCAEHPAKNGIELITCGDCQVDRVTVEGKFEAGIAMREHSFLCRVSGCSLSGCDVGILLQRLREGPAGDYLPNLVSDCMVYSDGNGTAVRCDGAIVMNLTGIIVFNTAIGFHLINQSNSVSISGSRTFQLTDKALLVENSHELNVSGNIFCWHVHEGIVVRDSWWGSIVGNNIIDNGSFNCGQPDFTFRHRDLAAEPPHFDGIRLENSCGYTVSGNAVFNWSAAPPMDTPIRLDDRCHDCVVTSNACNFYGNEDPAIVPATAGEASLNVGHGPGPFNRDGVFLPEHWCQSWVPSHLRHFMDADQVPGTTPTETWQSL